MNEEDLSGNTKQYFKLINGKWYVTIPDYISEGFETLKEAALHLVDLDNELENSPQAAILMHKMRSYE